MTHEKENEKPMKCNLNYRFEVCDTSKIPDDTKILILSHMFDVASGLKPKLATTNGNYFSDCNTIGDEFMSLLLLQKNRMPVIR